jgi:Arylsulfotransferase (ASST)
LRSNTIWPDHVIEVEPVGSSGGNIVWEWHAWDHLIQDYNATKENYGVVKDHPELIDINFGSTDSDWTHINAVDYNEEFDQILLSAHNFNEIWVIDHSTTTEEAAGHTGGNSGKGGDLLYRWGNPQAYDAGDAHDQQYFGQHGANWIDEGCPGAGNILVFNNGDEGRRYSSVDEIVPPVGNNGNYQYVAGQAYGPDEPIWIYIAETPTDMFSMTLSSVQRLPNGDTLICSANQGLLVEVTQAKEIVWKYQYQNNQYPNANSVARVVRYPLDYPGIPKAKSIDKG